MQFIYPWNSSYLKLKIKLWKRLVLTTFFLIFWCKALCKCVYITVLRVLRRCFTHIMEIKALLGKIILHTWIIQAVHLSITGINNGLGKQTLNALTMMVLSAQFPRLVNQSEIQSKQNDMTLLTTKFALKQWKSPHQQTKY